MNLARHTLAAWACACLFTACGGGGESTTPPTTTTTSAQMLSPASATVQIEGCVLGDHEQPRAAAVHAIGADGRLVANATSNADGIFVLHVPARTHVTVGVDAPGHESLDLLTGSSNTSLGGCLRDGTA